MKALDEFYKQWRKRFSSPGKMWEDGSYDVTYTHELLFISRLFANTRFWEIMAFATEHRDELGDWIPWRDREQSDDTAFSWSKISFTEFLGVLEWHDYWNREEVIWLLTEWLDKLTAAYEMKREELSSVTAADKDRGERLGAAVVIDVPKEDSEEDDYDYDDDGTEDAIYAWELRVPDDLGVPRSLLRLSKEGRLFWKNTEITGTDELKVAIMELHDELGRYNRNLSRKARSLVSRVEDSNERGEIEGWEYMKDSVNSLKKFLAAREGRKGC